MKPVELDAAEAVDTVLHALHYIRDGEARARVAYAALSGLDGYDAAHVEVEQVHNVVFLGSGVSPALVVLLRRFNDALNWLGALQQGPMSTERVVPGEQRERRAQYVRAVEQSVRDLAKGLTGRRWAPVQEDAA